MEVRKMGKCILCGKKIQPYFEACFDCYQDTKGSQFKFAEPIVRSEFMKEMGINA